MSTLIGAEYLIGNAFVCLGRTRNIYFNELKGYGIQVKEACSQKGIDVILFLSSSNLERAVYDFSQYFECTYNEVKKDRYISLKDDVQIESLEESFLNAFPAEILITLFENARCLAA